MASTCARCSTRRRADMPIHTVTMPNGGSGFQWGGHGKKYANRKDAERQAAAAHAHGYQGDAEFEESKHPRGEGGQFTGTNGAHEMAKALKAPSNASIFESGGKHGGGTVGWAQ